MLNVTISLPERFKLFTGDNHEIAEFSFVDMEKADIERLLSGPSGAVVRAMRVVAMNTYNGGGSGATAAEKQAKLLKRLDAWRKGEWAITERGESHYTAWKDEVYLPECIEQGMTLAQANAFLREKVTERLGKNTKASFANYIEATAIESADDFDGDRAAAREAIESYYEERLEARRKEQAKSAKKIAAPKIDLSKFKKNK